MLFSQINFCFMRKFLLLSLLILLLSMNVTVGAISNKKPAMCTSNLENGLEIILRDTDGKPLKGAEITSSPAMKPNFYEVPFQEGIYLGLYEGKGYYTFTIKKYGYQNHVETIKLERTDCHVIKQVRTILLAPQK